MTLDRQILLNILALDKGFEEFEFIHSYLGSPVLVKMASKIPLGKAYEELHKQQRQIPLEFDDDPPYYRQTYAQALIQSVLAQTEYFVFGSRTHDIKKLVELFFGVSIPRPFALQRELANLKGRLENYGYDSIGQFKKARQSVSFDNSQQVSRFVRQRTIALRQRVERRMLPLFHFDMNELLNKSALRVTGTSPDDPPCHYRYRGHFHGSVGLGLKRSYYRDYLDNFIAHEVMPGHHFYYLVKEQYLQAGVGDALMAVDPYYSPENVVNEGLAVNSDLMLGEAWDVPTASLLLIDKFLHKLYYNAWYAENVDGADCDDASQLILKDEFGLRSEEAKSRLRYFTHEAKWYTPCYALGIERVAAFIESCGRGQIPLMYGQHSAGTLGKLGSYYERTHAA